MWKWSKCNCDSYFSSNRLQENHQLRFLLRKGLYCCLPNLWLLKGGCLAGFCDLCSTWDDLLPPKSSNIPKSRYVRWQVLPTDHAKRFGSLPATKKTPPIPRNQVQVPSSNLSASFPSPLKKTLWLIEENSWGSFLVVSMISSFEESEISIINFPYKVGRIQSRWPGVLDPGGHP